MPNRDTADLVVVGAGTIGGWASVFAKELGAERVVVLEKGEAGQGASSRAAGIVRAQGGTPETVALGMWSIDFYRSQQERYGTDSGFRELGYLILATDDVAGAGSERPRRDAARGRARRRPVRRRGGGRAPEPDARPGRRSAARRTHPATGASTRRGTSARTRSRCSEAGVELRERTPFLGVRSRNDGTVIGVETPDGTIATERLLLTGRSDAPRGREARGRALLRRRGPAPGRRDRAARGLRRRTPADGLRERDRPLLATRGGRAPVRHVQPR